MFITYQRVYILGMYAYMNENNVDDNNVGDDDDVADETHAHHRLKIISL